MPPTPDWQTPDGRIRLYRGDCRGIMPQLPTPAAIVTDPPYGVGAVDKGGRCWATDNAAPVGIYPPIAGDDEPFDPAHLIGAAPIVALWGANHYADRLPPRARWLVWDKRDGTRPNMLADCELAWTSDTRPARLFHHRWMGMIRASERGPLVYPAQKPVALFRWCLEVLQVPPGGLVLDPYMGSGSVGLACLETGHAYAGIELTQHGFDIAVGRLSAATAVPAGALFAERN